MAFESVFYVVVSRGGGGNPVGGLLNQLTHLTSLKGTPNKGHLSIKNTVVPSHAHKLRNFRTKLFLQDGGRSCTHI